MSNTKVNYEELNPYIPQNDNDENYALLTHYTPFWYILQTHVPKNAKNGTRSCYMYHF